MFSHPGSTRLSDKERGEEEKSGTNIRRRRERLVNNQVDNQGVAPCLSGQNERATL